MEVGESKLLIQPHPLNHWIEHVSQDFISEGEAKNVRIRYQLDPQIETVSFDKDKCEIILSNLLINALKHSPQDTEITIVSELLPETGRVRISIIDQGCGLKQVDTHKLFTRFYQGTGEQSGTGIGLSYSKFWSNSMAALSVHKITPNRGYLLFRATVEARIRRDYLPAESVSERTDA